MTEIAPRTRPMPTVGKWRAAALMRAGWQILLVAKYEETGVEEWLTIRRVMQIIRPLRVATLSLSDGSTRSCVADRASGYEFFTRTPSEARRAAEQKEKQTCTPSPQD